MRYQAAATSVPLLQDALGRILEASTTIALVSMEESEAYAEILAPARLGVYAVLRATYSEHPSLDPIGSSDAYDREETLSAAWVPSQPDRPLDDPTITRVRAALQHASQILDQIDASVMGAASLDERERLEIEMHFLEAREAIRAALERLTRHSVGT